MGPRVEGVPAGEQRRQGDPCGAVALEKKDFFNYNTNFKTFKKSRKNDFFLI
jgi:hypothetical protein